MLILLVDDDADDFAFFREALAESHSKARCLYAQDGFSALKLLEELVVLPDYLFLDINMPLMNGKELLKRIKSDARFKDIPVIIYSTTNNETEINQFFDLGAYRFLVKPSGFEVLIASLKTLIV